MIFADVITLDMMAIASVLIAAAGLSLMWVGRPVAAASAGPWPAIANQAGMAGGPLRRALGTLPGNVVGMLPRRSSTQTITAAAGRQKQARTRSAVRVDRRRHRARAVSAVPLAPHLSIEQQWSRIETRIAATVESACNSDQLHRQAQSMLDAADYAFEQLKRELDVLRQPKHVPVVVRGAMRISPRSVAQVQRVAAAA